MDAYGSIPESLVLFGAVQGVSAKLRAKPIFLPLPGIAERAEAGFGGRHQNVTQSYGGSSFMACCNVLSIVVQQQTVVFNFLGVH